MYSWQWFQFYNKSSTFQSNFWTNKFYFYLLFPPHCRFVQVTQKRETRFIVNIWNIFMHLTKIISYSIDYLPALHIFPYIINKQNKYFCENCFLISLLFFLAFKRTQQDEYFCTGKCINIKYPPLSSNVVFNVFEKNSR